jgi:predicted ATPase
LPTGVELQLRMMQTLALVTLQGAGAPGVDLGYRQARAVCAEIDDATLLGPVLYGLWNLAVPRGFLSVLLAAGRDARSRRRHGRRSRDDIPRSRHRPA